jgi:hypothetical protein
MASIVAGARPIISSACQRHLDTHIYKNVALDHYIKQWRAWLTDSSDKTLAGLSDFTYGDFTHGTSQTFDHFVLRHGHKRTIAAFKGDFAYHRCISRHQNFVYLRSSSDLVPGMALIISVPFSATGRQHAEFTEILQRCDTLDIPVCLDLAYWGIAKNIRLDLGTHSCVEEITCSLSKPFHTLEHHRAGVRFSKHYADDGISMLNEVKQYNIYTMSLAMHYMQRYSADWAWQQYGEQHHDICRDLELDATDTLIFGTSTLDKYVDFNRGIAGQHRVCISLFFKD